MRAITLWFVCKLCKGVFRSPDLLLKHKKDEHLTEFQKISFIVFEESEAAELTFSQHNNADDATKEFNSAKVDLRERGSMTATIKEEPTEFQLNNELNENEQTARSTSRRARAVKIKSEHHPYQTHNPFVSLKRLTLKEIEAAKCSKFTKPEGSFPHLTEYSYDDHSTQEKDGETDLCNYWSSVRSVIPLNKSLLAQKGSEKISYKSGSTLQNKFHQLERSHPTEEDDIAAHSSTFRIPRTEPTLLPNIFGQTDRASNGLATENIGKPFKCEVCDKDFSQLGGLRTHSLVHTGEKPYGCEICGKSFRQRYHLKQHFLIHTGVKPHECNVCHKTFNVKMNLREHMWRHTGERPYACVYCNCQGFFRKKHCRDHILKTHPEQPVPFDLQDLGPSLTHRRKKAATISQPPQPPLQLPQSPVVPVHENETLPKVEILLELSNGNEKEMEDYSYADLLLGL